MLATGVLLRCCASTILLCTYLGTRTHTQYLVSEGWANAYICTEQAEDPFSPFHMSRMGCRQFIENAKNDGMSFLSAVSMPPVVEATQSNIGNPNPGPILLPLLVMITPLVTKLR